jgi:TetR/AcrR family transcriptional regulator
VTNYFCQLAKCIIVNAVLLPHDAAMSAAEPQTKLRRAPKYDGVENRRRALEAALDVFSVVGYAGASTRAIAAAAGIEQGHLAYYFPNKMALWCQVIETFASEAEACLREQMALCEHSGAVETAQAVLPEFLLTFARNPRLARLMLQEFSVTSDRSGWLTEHFAKPVWVLMMPLFNRLKGEGRLGGAAPEIAYFSLIGSALITFGNADLIAQLAHSNPASPEWIDEAIRHMLGSVLAGARIDQ